MAGVSGAPRRSVQDRRAHLRVPTQLDVAYELPGGPALAAVALDIGLGGTRLESARPPPTGSPITVVARLPGATDKSRIPATVRWSRESQFGLEFGLVAARDTHLIVDMMRAWLRSRPPSRPPD